MERIADGELAGSASVLSRRRFLELAGVAVAAGALSPGMAVAKRRATAITLPATIAEAGRRLREGSLTSEAMTRAYLVRIRELEPRLNAFITLTEDQALETARTRDRELDRGRDRGPLHGIPIVHKDLFDTAGIRTTIGSQLFRDRVPGRDATIVRRLQAAGVVSLGKTHLNEFAAGVTGTNVFWGDAHNPWKLPRSPGGSSSGTGAAVAAGLCLGGTGSDTGGSVRVPASWNGIVGIRPTYGRVSLAGAYPRGPSFDTVGPFARSVRDTALLLQAMAGYDRRDPVSLRARVPDYTAGLGRGVRGLRIGVISNYTFRDLDAPVNEAMLEAVNTFDRLGAKVGTVRIPMLEGGAKKYGEIFSTILSFEFHQILGEQYRRDPTVFGPIVRADLARGAGISEATYREAQTDRLAATAAIRKVFRHVDVLVTPMMPAAAPPLTAAPEVYARARQYTLPFSVARLPSVSVPNGFTPTDLPIGLQIIGDRLDEPLILRVAAAFESATEFGRGRPPVYRRRIRT